MLCYFSYYWILWKTNDLKYKNIEITVGIDASNLRAGGGITHIVELLSAALPERQGIGRVVVWGGRKTLSRLPDRNWLVKKHEPVLDKSQPWRILWRRRYLDKLTNREGCHILFAPGGIYRGSFRPIVTMSRNMLPFEKKGAATIPTTKAQNEK